MTCSGRSDEVVKVMKDDSIDVTELNSYLSALVQFSGHFL